MAYMIRYVDRDTGLAGITVLVSRENALRFVSELKFRLRIKEISWTTESRWDYSSGLLFSASRSFAKLGTSAKYAVPKVDTASGGLKARIKSPTKSFSASIVAIFKWLTNGRTNERGSP